MSRPTHPVPDPHADPLVGSVLRAASGGEAGGCPDAELVALYAERELSAGAHVEVEAHVERCGRCQAMVAALVRALPEVGPAAGAEAEVATGGGFAAWFAGWRWLVPAASLTAVAVVAVWMGGEPADEAAGLGRVAGEVVGGDSFVPQATAPSGQAAARSQDLLALSRVNPAAPADPAAPETGAGDRPQQGAQAIERAYRARQGAAPTTAPAGETQAKAAADAAGRTDTSGFVASTIEGREAAARGAPAVSAERRAADETAQSRESAAAAIATSSPPAPAAMAPAAPARGDAPVFRANLAAASWRVRQGVVERTRGDGAWVLVTVPAGVTVIAVAPVSAEMCWAITTDAVFTVTDGGTWTRTARPPAAPLSAVSATSPRAATVTAGETRFATSDGGATWAPVQ